MEATEKLKFQLVNKKECKSYGFTLFFLYLKALFSRAKNVITAAKNSVECLFWVVRLIVPKEKI